LIVGIAVSILVGGLYAVLAAFFESWAGVPILISTLLLNYIARSAVSYLVRGPFKDPDTQSVATQAIPPDARISTWSAGILMLLAVVVMVLFIKRTVRGYEMGMMGANREFARYGGVDAKRTSYAVMFISGGAAGLVGLVAVLHSQFRFVDGALVDADYAWTGVLVALLAFGRPVGVLLAGLFFAALTTGGLAMQREFGISGDLSNTIQASAIIFLTFNFALRAPKRLRRRRQSRDFDQVESSVTVPSEGDGAIK